MNFLLDAQLSPAIAAWISREYPEHTASSLRSHGLVYAEDREIYTKARDLSAVLVTKDVDFKEMVLREGVPPQVIWVTCGNTSNANLRSILRARLPEVIRLLTTGEPLVELSD